MELEQFKGQDRSELSMIEVTHAILEESGEVQDFIQILEGVQAYLDMTNTELEDQMTRLYTDINIDGRFISLGENRWGLRAWYAIDAIDEEIVNSIDDEDLPRHRRRKRKSKVNAFGDDEDLIDYNDDDPEDLDDIYDDLDEDEDFEELDDEDDDLADLGPGEGDEDDEEADQELGVYARELEEIDEPLEEDIDLDEEDDDAAYDDEDEEEDGDYFEE